MSVSPDDSKNPKQLIRPWTAIAEMNRNIELPKTAYTLAFVLFMLQETKDQSPNCIERCLEWWGTLMQCLFTLAIHYVVLGLLTYYLVMLEYDTVPIDEAPAFLLLSTCSCVFTSFCMSDLVESFSMTHWLYRTKNIHTYRNVHSCTSYIIHITCTSIHYQKILFFLANN